MKVPTSDPLAWVTAAPLWQTAAGSAGASASPPRLMREPVLLTIPNDNFMERLQQTLAAQPADLVQLRANAASHRVRPPGRAEDWEPNGPPPLKLYQPAHGHFNLVAASLVCQVPGLPEHRVHPERKEEVAFVLRRWDTPTSQESAWVGDAAHGMRWAPIAANDAHTVAQEEQLLPLFPVNYAFTDRPRCLFVGLVPTSSAETYKQQAPTPTQPNSATELMQMAFRTRVAAPLNQIAAAPGAADATPGSPMVMLEFASFLNDWFPTSWAAVSSGTPPPINQPLYTILDAHVADSTISITWLEALRRAWTQREWITNETSTPPAGPLTLNLRNAKPPPSDLTGLFDCIAGAPPEASTTGVPGAGGADAPKLDPRGPDGLRYRVRCVYRRPECVLESDLVSDASVDFEIATFFDFDAPSRAVTISLPQLTGVGDLRKFRKNVNFLISKEMHSQIDMIKDLASTMAGGFNKPGPGLDVGWICSFSIPIITICALFVLIMFVILLNLVFWWLPFFEICLPVPKAHE